MLVFPAEIRKTCALTLLISFGIATYDFYLSCKKNRRFLWLRSLSENSMEACFRAGCGSMKKSRSLIVASMILTSLSTQAGQGDQIMGTWNTAEDKAQVEVFKQKDKYFGKIVSLKEPDWPANDEKGMAGQPKN